MTTVILVFVLVGMFSLMLVSWYNGLVRNKNRVAEAWSGIDVQLKRRTDLIPNLVETVKGYMEHEKSLLENITQLRNQSIAADTIAKQGTAEKQLSMGLGKLFAVAESYPELKSNTQFLELQKQMGTVEDEIQMARRYYNGTVRDNNTAIEQFPTNMIAEVGGFEKASFFELDDPADREVPKVNF